MDGFTKGEWRYPQDSVDFINPRTNPRKATELQISNSYLIRRSLNLKIRNPNPAYTSYVNEQF